MSVFNLMIKFSCGAVTNNIDQKGISKGNRNKSSSSPEGRKENQNCFKLLKIISLFIQSVVGISWKNLI